jgi:hypothetical protein
VNTTITDWLHIVRAEFVEIPDLSLTRAQIQRLWNLDDTMCDALVDALVRAGFLKMTRNKKYVRADRGTNIA